MESLNYSFIIPHKNSPDLLNRCVNSIPRRDDVEIIILDDNSDVSIINWDIFEFDNPKCIKLIRNFDNLGQGHLRNVGIKMALGKWLLFPDADDYYCEGFLDILDDYLSFSLDVLYFNAKTIYNNPMKSHNLKYVDNYNGEDSSLKCIKYATNAAWSKMVNREYVNRYNAVFESIRVGEDALFSILVGYFAKHIMVCKRVIYNYIRNENSVTLGNHSKEKYMQIIENVYKRNCFYRFIGLPQLVTPMWKLFFSNILNGDLWMLLYLKNLLFYNGKVNSSFYIDEIKKREVL